MQSGVDENAPIVLDMEDKITAIVEEDTTEARFKLTMRTLKSLIGEYSNYASAYHNKCPQTQETKDKYSKYIDVISVTVGKAIDSVKCGVIFHMPRHIAKYGRPLPYFMKYRKEYYMRQKLSRAPSNMNRLCWELENWHKTLRWKSTARNFDYTIMLDNSVNVDSDIAEQIEQLFLEFYKEKKELADDQRRVRAYKDETIRAAMSKYDAQHFVIDWSYYFERYKIACAGICQNQIMLANIVVKLCYEKYPKKSSQFMWVVAEDAILNNIRQLPKIKLPIIDNGGNYEYLGRKYSIVEVDGDELID